MYPRTFFLMLSLAFVSRSAAAFAARPSFLLLGRNSASSSLSSVVALRAGSSSSSGVGAPTTSSTLVGNLVPLENCLSSFGTVNADGGRTIFVDGSWHLSKDRDGREEYEKGPRIADARYFDIDDVSAKKGDEEELNPKGLPHMMPSKRLFGLAMDALDITNDDSLVVYGTEGCMFTSRAFYALRSMGHPPDKVHLMQGSLSEWQSKGGEVETGPKKAVSASDLDLTKEPTFRPTDAADFVDMTDVLRVVNAGPDSADADAVVVDARPAARFHAEVPEPRPGLRGGHMPGSVNVPFTDLLEMDDDATKFRPAAELRAAFERGGVDVDTDKRIICTCGSGVTACAVALALEECGRDRRGTYVYDGSWIEWGSDPDAPIVS